MSHEETKKPTGIKTQQDEVYGRRKWVIEQAPEDEEAEDDSLTVSTATKNLDAQARKLALDGRVGKRVVVTKELPKNKQGGFYCETCDCTMKDSNGWLDHINGREHNRRLGFNMKVERASVETVKAKLAGLKTAKANQKRIESFGKGKFIIVSKHDFALEEDFEKKYEEDEKKKAINKEFEVNSRKKLKMENEKIEAKLREEKKQEEVERNQAKNADKHENTVEKGNEPGEEEEEDDDDDQAQFPGLPMSFGSTKRKK